MEKSIFYSPLDLSKKTVLITGATAGNIYIKY